MESTSVVEAVDLFCAEISPFVALEQNKTLSVDPLITFVEAASKSRQLVRNRLRVKRMRRALIDSKKVMYPLRGGIAKKRKRKCVSFV